MTGKLPFNQYNSGGVIIKIMEGARPERPMNSVAIGPLHSLWQIAEDCWKQRPKERSTIDVVLNQLNQIGPHWVPPSPLAAVDSQPDDEEDSDWPSSFSTNGKPGSHELTRKLLIFISRGVNVPAQN